MPVQKYKQNQADPFVLSKSEVLHAVRDYLHREGYETRNVRDLCGVDLAAVNEYHTLMIEALGNHAEPDEKITLLTASQMDLQFSNQLMTLLRNYEKNPGKTLVLANPDTPRMRNKSETIKTALDELGVVRFWVKEDGSIEWD